MFPYLQTDYLDHNGDVTITYKGSLDGEHWFAIDNPAIVAGCWMGPKMPRKEEADMQTYRYEIVAPAVLDTAGNVVDDKVAIRIAHGEGLLVEPDKLDLLEKHHDEIEKSGRKYTEVQVNIRPF